MRARSFIAELDLSNLIEPFLKLKPVERLKGKFYEDGDTVPQFHKNPAEGRYAGQLVTSHVHRIGHAPVGRHGLTGPDRADFSGSLVADGKDEIHFWCAWLGELGPALAVESVCYKTVPT